MVDKINQTLKNENEGMAIELATIVQQQKLLNGEEDQVDQEHCVMPVD
eukprot:CAMPEP_0117032768 /NCGR_PEP_ID=MMETSP0472-20121206/23468_1 /TAXON_ID=693140 ORGANISM="Tiarina fusus, Strain LIS" /NCGR_SAMPLE_ID=MMETSP0472 /ASSEMBLY_ACC=CAM_ASM_000603 /LENGTH=47 /DNA_ID= /DNA_START= /DNA_END= /DNA_ORIENTATION=